MHASACTAGHTRRSQLEAGEGARLGPGFGESSLDAATQAIPLQGVQPGEARQLGQQRAQHRGRRRLARLVWGALPGAAWLPRQQASRQAVGRVKICFVAGIVVPQRAARDREERTGRAGVDPSGCGRRARQSSGETSSKPRWLAGAALHVHAQVGHVALLANDVVPCARVVLLCPVASEASGAGLHGLPQLEQDGGCSGVARQDRVCCGRAGLLGAGQEATARAARRTIIRMRLLGLQAAGRAAEKRQEDEGQGTGADGH